MKFTSNKVIDLGSAAFRQWRSTHSHCQFIHGYRLRADITFECDELDERNWVMDFGGLKDLKKTLEYTFDHKLVVAGDDPQLDLFKQLDEAGVAELVILDGGVGCERFAEFVLKTADTFVDEATEGRVRVQKVQINEHESNFATAYRTSSNLQSTIVQGDSKPFFVDEETLQILIEAGDAAGATLLEDNSGPVAAIETPKPKDEPPAAPVDPRAAPVGGNKGTTTKGGWFKGTTWG